MYEYRKYWQYCLHGRTETGPVKKEKDVTKSRAILSLVSLPVGKKEKKTRGKQNNKRVLCCTGDVTVTSEYGPLIPKDALWLNDSSNWFPVHRLLWNFICFIAQLYVLGSELLLSAKLETLKWFWRSMFPHAWSFINKRVRDIITSNYARLFVTSLISEPLVQGNCTQFFSLWKCHVTESQKKIIRVTIPGHNHVHNKCIKNCFLVNDVIFFNDKIRFFTLTLHLCGHYHFVHEAWWGLETEGRRW